MKKIWSVLILALVVALAIPGAAPIAAARGLSGAIFTTMVDGSRVNANIYEDKDDVYLDGGPGPNAPQGAAGLPDGDYYFQVTDPPGKVLLSVDPITSRKIRIEDGIIVYVYPALTQTKYRGKWYGTHETGTDIDHNSLTVQLMPYDNTPNKGGVYKAWITPVGKYSPGSGSFGFIPAWSKTDNFKAKKGKPFTPPILIVKKFSDSNANGVWDIGEQEITGWQIDITDPLSVTNTYYTQVNIQAMPEGTWIVTEATPVDWLQTAVYVDGVAKTLLPTTQVEVAGLSEEVHTVIFGNVQLGDISGCKWYDRNGDGYWDAGEPAIEGWLIKLDGVAVNSQEVHLSGYTGASGCVKFDGLLPGNYTVSEVMPTGNWIASTATSYQVVLAENGSVSRQFGNFCYVEGTAEFGTKGYWHNKNGLSETTAADLTYLNSLLPWQSPSPYFEDGDEPIDGCFSSGMPVDAVNGEWGEEIAPAGSALAEQSHFLIDSNAGGDPREQLAQQLDAFIMNALHRLDGLDVVIQLPDGSWMSATGLINQAIGAWAVGSNAEREAVKNVLDSLNNNSAVPYRYVCYDPCPVVYPPQDKENLSAFLKRRKGAEVFREAN